MQNHMSLVKDVRGCMTQFVPLTPDIVASQSQDGLTYDELKHTLWETGMDINKVRPSCDCEATISGVSGSN